LEAWEEALSELDEILLAEHLQMISYPLLTRRVGTIFDLLGHSPGQKLKETIDQLCDYPEKSCDVIALLPGFHFSDINEKWNVLIP
jgi:hypothetical protein